MRKSIFLAVLSLLAVVAVACGGGKGNNNTNGNTGGSGNGNANAGASGNDARGDTANGGSSDAEKEDSFALYKKQGRSWMTKNTSKTGDNPENVSYSKVEIVSVADDHAMVKRTTLGADQKPIAGMPEAEAQKMPFTNPDAPAPEGDAPKVERAEETIDAAGQSWECWVTTTETNGMTTKAWSSKKFPGLTVRSETTGEMEGVGKMTSSSELVEWTE